MFVDVAHVALQVPSLEESVDHYTRVLGLRELEHRGNSVFLTHGPSHACVQLSEGGALALDHMSLSLRDEGAFAELETRLAAVGTAIVSDAVEEPGVARGIRFTGPTGHLYEAVLHEHVAVPPSLPMARAIRGEGYATTGVRPNRLGHLTAQTSDVKANVEFLTGTLDFKLSDSVGVDEPWMVFARCNNDHHAVSFMKGRDALHHFAFEVSSVVDLANLGDCLCEANRQILWGPGRHGAGDNIAIYHQEPSGCIVEYYTDMQRIFDDRWEARTWDAEDYRFNNLWGGPMPDADLIDAVAPCLAEQPA